MKMMWTTEIQILNGDMIVTVGIALLALQIPPPPPPIFFRDFNRIQTHGLCIYAAVFYHLSYEDPFIGRRPFCWVHLNPWKEWNMKHAFNLILSFWGCLLCILDFCSCYNDFVYINYCCLIDRSFMMPVIRWDHSCLD